VLVAEDNPINQQVCRELLSEYGMIVETVEDGELAVHAVLAAPETFDLVLMDVQMPKLDGLEATRRLRVGLKGRALPIIAMTAHVLASERERCFEAGMDDHLGKPIDPARLVETLCRWLDPAGATAAPLMAEPAKTRPPAGLLPETLPPFDLDESRTRIGQDRLIVQLLRLFARQYRDTGAAITAALEAGDFKTLGRIAHSIKGTAALFGAAELTQSAVAVETAARSGKSTGMGNLADLLVLQLVAAVEAAESIPPDAAPAASGAAAVGQEELAKMVESLYQLLDRQSLKARGCLAELAAALEGRGYDEDLLELRQNLEALRFGEARSRFDALANRLGLGRIRE
jgi:CheY-like chemotaxis protein